MTPAILSTHEIAQLLKDKEAVIIRPLDPQPEWINRHGIPVADRKGNPKDSPFGKVGDEFWVRETWYSDVTQSQYEDAYGGSGIFYKATEIHPEIFYWKKASSMPKWASRITIIHKNTTVDKLDGKWIFLTEVKVK